MHRRLTHAFLLGLLGLSSGNAKAYVRELTSTGAPVAWSNPCVPMHLYTGSPPPVLSTAGLFAAGMAAAGAWSYAEVACTDIRLSIVSEPAASAQVGYDSKNVIVFRQETWCRDPPRIDDAGIVVPDCYPASALALTSIFKNKNTGEILDADIEFNAVNYTWGDLVVQPALAISNTADFQNALTHELGHVLGLDHNCFTTNDGSPRGVDNTGAPEVDCYNNPELPDAVAQATMYPSVVLTDTERRSLSPDDEQGVCEIYPHAHEVCPSPSDGGCIVASGSPARMPWPDLFCAAVALFLVGFALRRSRERI